MSPVPTDRAREPHLTVTPVTFQILLTLADGERHGYAIMREVADRTDGAVRLGPGTLYGSLKRLLESDLSARAPSARTPSSVTSGVATTASPTAVWRWPGPRPGGWSRCCESRVPSA